MTIAVVVTVRNSNTKGQLAVSARSAGFGKEQGDYPKYCPNP